jgi:hypothetical protein
MERHQTSVDVLAPAMHFLTRAASMVSSSTDLILEKKAIPLVSESAEA